MVTFKVALLLIGKAEAMYKLYFADCHLVHISTKTSSAKRYHKQQQFFCEFSLDVQLCFEKSYDGMHLAFGRTLDRRCHFKTSHSNKAGSTTVTRARFTGKGSRSTAVLPQ
jgi:hypothetical protein